MGEKNDKELVAAVKRTWGGDKKAILAVTAVEGDGWTTNEDDEGRPVSKTRLARVYTKEPR